MLQPNGCIDCWREDNTLLRPHLHRTGHHPGIPVRTRLAGHILTMKRQTATATDTAYATQPIGRDASGGVAAEVLGGESCDGQGGSNGGPSTKGSEDERVVFFCVVTALNGWLDYSCIARAVHEW